MVAGLQRYYNFEQENLELSDVTDITPKDTRALQKLRNSLQLKN